MCLRGNEERVLVRGQLDELDEVTVGRGAREHEAALGDPAPVRVVDLVAVTVALGDVLAAVRRGDDGALAAGIGIDARHVVEDADLDADRLGNGRPGERGEADRDREHATPDRRHGRPSSAAVSVFRPGGHAGIPASSSGPRPDPGAVRQAGAGCVAAAVPTESGRNSHPRPARRDIGIGAVARPQPTRCAGRRSRPTGARPGLGDRMSWCRRRGSNPRPSVYKTAALPLCYTGRRSETIEKIGGFGASEALLTTFGGASSRHTSRHVPFIVRARNPWSGPKKAGARAMREAAQFMAKSTVWE